MNRRRGARGETAATRERILDAATEVMHTRGLARSTTKEIARAAACSEAALYMHFADKEALFLAVLEERLPVSGEVAGRLTDAAGTQTVSAHLTEVAHQALHFYSRSMPIAASVFSDRDLLARHRERLAAGGGGPRQATEQLTAYLEAEQRLGRVAAGASAQAGAALLLGACFQRAFLASYLDEDVTPGAAWDDFVADLVSTVLRGLAAG